MENLSGYIVAGKYQLEKIIGKGSFGEIYQGFDIEDQNKIGVKVELLESPYQQLIEESKIYDTIRGGPGVPYMLWFGNEGNYNFLVMELLGLSLEVLFEKCQKSFSLKSILLLTDQMISRIHYFHINGYIHRDIKPDNFVMGYGKRSHLVYIIDYGLCKKYINSKTREHIPYIEGKSLTGTARYASIYTHLGIEQSRRDDLESLSYVLVYFLNGKLPWQDININDKAKRYEEIKNIKVSVTAKQLCEGLPKEFLELLVYAKSLQFEETPNYNYLKQLFQRLLYKMNFDNDFIYDWSKLDESPKIIIK